MAFGFHDNRLRLDRLAAWPLWGFFGRGWGTMRLTHPQNCSPEGFQWRADFWATVKRPEVGICTQNPFGDLAPSTRKSLAIAIVRFWCAKPVACCWGGVHQSRENYQYSIEGRRFHQNLAPRTGNNFWQCSGIFLEIYYQCWFLPALRPQRVSTSSVV